MNPFNWLESLLPSVSEVIPSAELSSARDHGTFMDIQNKVDSIRSDVIELDALVTVAEKELYARGLLSRRIPKPKP